jgi:hypothetical protein
VGSPKNPEPVAAPTRRRRTLRSRLPRRVAELNALSDHALLGLRLCDLGLRLPGSELETRVKQLYVELADHALTLRPHAWLSTEWFVPDGVPGIAIPFYLAHPRLAALEAHHMHEVEGGTERSFRQLLRHEAGHALDSAYRLHERAEWRELFGSFKAPYHRRYQPKPYSKRFVRHLDNWYAQSHPAEDFAETVAVWLDPESNWRARYRGWPAMRKLSYVNRLMREIAGVAPLVRRRDRIEPISALSLTVGEYYEEKRRRYRLNRRDVYERDLRRLFGVGEPGAGEVNAATYLRHARPTIRALVASTTGAHRYVIDRLLRELIERSAALKLAVVDNDARANDRHARRVAARLSQYVAEGHARIAR